MHICWSKNVCVCLPPTALMPPNSALNQSVLACLSSEDALSGCFCSFALTTTCSVINYWCTFFFPRKIQKGPGILTDLVTAVLTWFVVTVACLWCCHSLASFTHKPVICMLLFLSGSWGYIVSSKPWQSQGWYSVLLTLNSKAFDLELPSALMIFWVIWQYPSILLP